MAGPHLMLLRKLSLGGLLIVAACGASEPSLPPAPPRASGYPQPGHLIPLLTLRNPRLPETARLIAAVGNEPEKDAAGRQLTALSESVASESWRQAQLPVIARMHQGPLGESQQRRLLDNWRRRYQVRIYDAMTALGGDSVLDYCLDVSNADLRPASEQQLALAVLAAHGKAEVGPPSRPEAWGMPEGSPGAGPTTRFGPTGSPWSAPPSAQEPAASMPAEAPRVEGGEIIDVNEVVDRLRPYFLVCYQRALGEFGRFGAWIILEADVSAANGRVFEITGKGDESTPPSMMQCLYGVVKQAQFAPPRGGDARVSIPLTFTQG